ncbi:MAG: glycosyltransferase, partial [Mariprofundales bacterium]|nr:glycosyltransferase [Mariprofundales bacterium]
DVPNACLIHSREIAEQMVELGHEVEMFLPLPLKKQRWCGISHHWIRFWGFDVPRRRCFLIETCIKLWWANLKNSFDCVYLREMEGADMLVGICRWLSLPLFVEVNGWLLDDLRLMDASAADIEKARRSQCQLMRAAHGVIASTVGNAGNVKQHYGIESVMTQELGVNVELFSKVDRQHARKHLGFDDGIKYTLFAGSFHPHHDLKTLIQAFARVQREMPMLRLLLVGDGAQWQQAKTWVDEERVQTHVDFMGSQPYEEMAYWFSAVDLLVSPLTQQKIEQQRGALATKVWEAMAAGTRLLLTDMPGTQSYDLLSRLAWVTPPEDVATMADSIWDVLHADDGREVQAQSYVLQERSWKKAAEDTIGFMQHCLIRV